MNFFDDPYLKNVLIEKEKLEESLELKLEGDFISYPSLSKSSSEELEDLMMKSIGYMGYVSEYLARTKKRLLDGNSYLDKLLADGMLENSTAKVTGLKDIIKGSEVYVAAAKNVNTLQAYYDYLSRLFEVLDKYFYAMKLKLSFNNTEQRKPQP